MLVAPINQNMHISNTLVVKSIPKVLGYGSLAAVLLGAYDFTGGRLKGWNRDPEQDEFERKQAIRQNRRRPVEETIAEVGEGRGKGYHNRMRDRANRSQAFMRQDTKREGERESRRTTESIFQKAPCKSFPYLDSLNSDISYVHTMKEDQNQTSGNAKS